MQRSTSRLGRTKFDILIIGGGITGACLAWDAVNRGLSVALIEKDDFGAQTSAASSKLLHGGIRYLQQGRLGKVRESALERAYFQKIAPHLTRYIPFVVPAYKSLMKSKWVLYAGMLVYRLICLGQNRSLTDPGKRVPGWKGLSREELTDYVPDITLQEITGGVVFYESHMHSSERMTLAFIAAAQQAGAQVANYVRADSFVRHGDTISGVQTTDVVSGESLTIHATCVVNAAGPWIPLLNNTESKQKLVTAFSKGAHIVTDRVTADAAIALATTKKNVSIINRGGRHVFVIPWRGHSLIGTTYDAYRRALDEVHPTEADIAELIDDINSAIGQPLLTRDKVRYAFAGIYPLIDDDINTQVYQGTGEYQVIDHAAMEGIEGLVTVFGAKYTTARLVAEKALDSIAARFDKSLKPCRTRNLPLPCGAIDDIGSFRESKRAEYSELLDPAIIDHLVTNYGTDIDAVVQYVRQDRQWATCLCAGLPDIEAQAVYAIEQEMVCHLDDFIFRRSGLGTLGYPGDEPLQRCLAIFAGQLGWDAQRQSQEMQRVQQYYRYQ
jgi:glycerol-3-phosphate dehydrogenase